MKKALIGTNALLLLMIAVAVARTSDEGLAQAIGAALWFLPPVLAIRTLRHSQAAGARAALVANVIAILLLGGIAAFAARERLEMLLGFVVVSVPLILNMWAVRRHRRRVMDDANYEEASSPGIERVEPTVSDALEPGSSRSTTMEDFRFASRPYDPSEEGNYLARHWRGDFPLGHAYWINGSLVTVAMVMVVALIRHIVDRQDVSLRSIALFNLVTIVFIVAVSVWSPVGIWRSASRHTSRGGLAGWAIAAQIMVVIGALGSINVVVTQLLPQLREFSLIASGEDPMGKVKATVSADGAAISLVGSLGAGSSEEVIRLIEQAPGVKTLVLHSPGGRILEASRIAAVVRERSLNTYVEGQCASACTYIFLAGADRAATPNAQIGFHRPTFPGLDAASHARMTADMIQHYRNAGMSETFLNRVRATPPEAMWYPTRDELIDFKVINRVSLGGEMATNFRSRSELELAYAQIPLFKAMDARFPGTLARAVDASWVVHERGGRDAELTAVARQVLVEHYPKLLATTSDEVLLEFLDLIIDETAAAQAVSDEACVMLLNAQLNVARVLPTDLVQREAALNMKLLETSPSGVTLSSHERDSLVQDMLNPLQPHQLEALGEPGRFSHRPDLVCEANIALLEGIASLPVNKQARAFRTLQLLALENPGG